MPLAKKARIGEDCVAIFTQHDPDFGGADDHFVGDVPPELRGFMERLGATNKVVKLKRKDDDKWWVNGEVTTPAENAWLQKVVMYNNLETCVDDVLRRLVGKRVVAAMECVIDALLVCDEADEADTETDDE